MSIKEVRYKLLSKGLNNDIIEDYISNNRDELDEYEVKSIINIFNKKSGMMEKEEIKSFLLKKGYSMDNIKEALSEVE